MSYAEVIQTSTHNLCFEQIYKNGTFLSENFKCLEMKFSIYLNSRVRNDKLHTI